MPPRSAECSRVGFAADSPLREMDSNFWFLVAKGQTVIRDGTAVSKTGADLLGNRRFESISLRRRVRREPEFVAPGPPNAKLLRVVAITDDLDFLKAQPARVPTRKELARIAVDGRVRVRPGS